MPVAQLERRRQILTAEKPPEHHIDFEGIPQHMALMKRWVLWIWKRDGKGKFTKMPIQANGRAASSTDPDTWCDFATAVAAAQRMNCGIGFVLGEGVCGVDFDGCRDPDSGEIDSTVTEFCKKLGYCEVSPSKTGIKVFVHGELPAKITTQFELPGGLPVEIYRSGRFFCVTGCRAPFSPDDVQDRQYELQSVYARLGSGASLNAVERYQRTRLSFQFLPVPSLPSNLADGKFGAAIVHCGPSAC